MSNLFNERINNYLALFELEFTDFEGLYEYIEPIFSNIDMRNRMQLIEKALLIHKMLFKDSKNEAFMLLELLLVVLVDFYGENYCENTNSIPHYSVLENVSFKKNKAKAVKLINFINKKRQEDTLNEASFSIDVQKHLVIDDNYGLFELLMYYWFNLHKNKFYNLISSEEKQKQINDNIADLERFINFMKIIK